MSVEDLSRDERTGRLSALLRVTLAGGETSGIPLQGRAELQARVPVLVRPLARGQRVMPGDVVLSWEPVARSGAETVTDPAELVGREASRRLPAQRALAASDVRAPVLVHRGDALTLVYASGGLTLTVPAKSMESGGLDEIIRVRSGSAGR